MITMKELEFRKAAEFTSPNPLVLVCTEKPDGSVNLAPVSYVSYLSSNPPMLGFAMGKGSYTGKRTRETGKAVLAVPGSSLRDAAIRCGSVSGRDTDKVQSFQIPLASLPGTSIQIPADTRLALVVSLSQTVEVGNHFLHICSIDKIYGDEEKDALFAWDGYLRAACAREK